MATAKAYFLLPNQFDYQQGTSSALAFNVRSWKVGGVEQVIYGDYDTEYPPAQEYQITTYNRTSNDFLSLDNTQPYNIWNPFVDCMGLTFDLFGEYGQCTGTLTGSDYGTWTDSVFVDKVEVVDGGGATQFGAFAFEFDEDQDFEFRLIARANVIQITDVQEIRGKYESLTGNTHYTGYNALGDAINLINYGWIDNTAVPPNDQQVGNIQKYIGTALPVPQTTEEDRGYDACCPCGLVLASTVDFDDYVNDFFGAYHLKQSNESIEFKLYKDGVEVDDSAVSTTNQKGNLILYELRWQDVLLTYGEDVYYVTKEVSVPISGGSFVLYTQQYNTVKLKEFTWDNANGTIRLDSYFNNILESQGVNFKDTAFKNSIRVIGSFSNEQYEYVEESQYNTEFKNINNYKRIESKYTLEVSGLRSCIWNDFPGFYLLADNLKVTDYNKRAYNYEYKTIPVEIDDFPESQYLGNRLAVHSINFRQKNLNKISKYG